MKKNYLFRLKLQSIVLSSCIFTGSAMGQNCGVGNSCNITPNSVVTANLVVDRSSANEGIMLGNICGGPCAFYGFKFGGQSSGEGIGSNRKSGNQNLFGLDFYTYFEKRFQIFNRGEVHIGIPQTNPLDYKFSVLNRPGQANTNFKDRNAYFENVVNCENSNPKYGIQNFTLGSGGCNTSVTGFDNFINEGCSNGEKTGINNNVVSGNNIVTLNTGIKNTLDIGSILSQDYAKRIGIHNIIRSTTENNNFQIGLFNDLTGSLTNSSSHRVGLYNIMDNSYPYTSVTARRIGMFTSATGANNIALFVHNGYTTSSPNPSQSDGWAMWLQGKSYFSQMPVFASDIKLKKEIENYSNALDKVLKLQAKVYKFKDEYAHLGFNSKDIQIGYIAEEVKAVLPELVSSLSNIVKDKDGKSLEFIGVNYISIIPLVTQAIKEQQTQIEDIKSENQMLKERLANIEKMIGIKNEGLNEIKDALFDPNPNPSNGNTEIKYQLSQEYSNAYITIMGLDGKKIVSYKLNAQKGKSSINADLSKLASGTYLYSLVAGERVIDSKKVQIGK